MSDKHYHSKSPEELRKYIKSKNKARSKNKTLLIIFLDIVLIVIIFIVINFYILQPKKTEKLILSGLTFYSSKKGQGNYFLFIQNNSNRLLSLSKKNFQVWLKIENSQGECFAKNSDFSSFQLTSYERKALLLSIEPEISLIKSRCLDKEGFLSLFISKPTLKMKVHYDEKSELIFSETLNFKNEF